jgi:hypothetical protein
MDKLDDYLDQVCRGIGGPRALRQHVRQELREHLLDAAARYKEAGMPEEEAVARALDDFGRPEEVRSGLEEAHGQRLLAVVIDKALDWKEKTMRARWLWSTWAHFAVWLAIVVEVLILTFIVMFIIPRYQKLMHDGIIDVAELNDHGAGWMAGFLNNLSYVGGNYTTPLFLLTLAGIALFEWRVRNENKTLMRLSALGTVAAGLAVVVMLTAGSLGVISTLAAPAMGRMARPWAAEQITTIDTSVGGIERAVTAKNWDDARAQATEASGALSRLSVGPALSSLVRSNDRRELDELRAQLAAARERFGQVELAITARDAARVEAALKDFRDAYGSIQSKTQPVKQ